MELCKTESKIVNINMNKDNILEILKLSEDKNNSFLCCSDDEHKQAWVCDWHYCLAWATATYSKDQADWLMSKEWLIMVIW